MSDDPLNTETPPVTPPAADRRGCVCEFCGCQLTPRGEIIRMGQMAKDTRKHEEVVEGLNKDIRRLEAELTETKKKLQEATTSPAPSTRRVGALIE